MLCLVMSMTRPGSFLSPTIICTWCDNVLPRYLYSHLFMQRASPTHSVWCHVEVSFWIAQPLIEALTVCWKEEYEGCCWTTVASSYNKCSLHKSFLLQLNWWQWSAVLCTPSAKPTMASPARKVHSLFLDEARQNWREEPFPDVWHTLGDEIQCRKKSYK